METDQRVWFFIHHKTLDLGLDYYVVHQQYYYTVTLASTSLSF